jgi:hypothetical protein
MSFFIMNIHLQATVFQYERVDPQQYVTWQWHEITGSCWRKGDQKTTPQRPPENFEVECRHSIDGCQSKSA